MGSSHWIDSNPNIRHVLWECVSQCAPRSRGLFSGFEPPIAPAIGHMLGCLGRHPHGSESGRWWPRHWRRGARADAVLEVLNAHQCLAASPRSAVRARWLTGGQRRDRDVAIWGMRACNIGSRSVLYFRSVAGALVYRSAGAFPLGALLPRPRRPVLRMSTRPHG